MTTIAPQLEFAFKVELQLAGRIHAPGMASGGERGYVSVASGRFEGPELRGTVLPGGGDFPTIRPDGVVCFDAHYVLLEEDGSHIFIHNTGYRVATEAVTARLMAGEVVDGGEYYFRTAPTFDAPVGRHDWLTKNVFVGVGRRLPEGNSIEYFVVR